MLLFYVLVVPPLVLAAHKTPTALFVNTQVATLQHGTLTVPNATTELMVEVGCSDFNTLDETVINRHPTAFLVAFEPLLDKYAVLLSRGSTRLNSAQRYGSMHADSNERRKKLNQAVPLGFHHPRGVVLPMAVSEHGGLQDMSVTDIAGCSSLRALNRNVTWGRFCLSVLENRKVDTISVAEAMALLPHRLPIRLLKLDAQGESAACVIIVVVSTSSRAFQSPRFNAATNAARCRMPPEQALIST